MARSAKPRKRYNSNKHVAHVPMMDNSRDNLALGLRMAVEALILAPSIDTYNGLSRRVMAMGIALAAQHEPVELAKRTLIGIEERFRRMQKIGVSPEEAQQLREAADGMDKLLPKIKADVFAAAKIRTRQFCAAHGVA